MSISPDDGVLTRTTLSHRLDLGHKLQHVVPPGHWFGAYVDDNGETAGFDYALVGCTVRNNERQTADELYTHTILFFLLLVVVVVVVLFVRWLLASSLTTLSSRRRNTCKPSFPSTRTSSRRWQSPPPQQHRRAHNQAMQNHPIPPKASDRSRCVYSK